MDPLGPSQTQVNYLTENQLGFVRDTPMRMEDMTEEQLKIIE